MRNERVATRQVQARDRIDADIRETRDDLADANVDSGRPIGCDGGKFDVSSGRSWIGNASRKAKENPKLLGYKMQNNAYKFSWVLIPISAPLVWLLFAWRR